jgi:integrase
VTATAFDSDTRRIKRNLAAHEHLLDRRFVGPVDELPAEAILALLPQLPTWPIAPTDGNGRIRGADAILRWLFTMHGDGWQARWVAAGADTDLTWIDTLTPGDGRSTGTRRQEHMSGLACLLLCRVVLPSYDFLSRYQSTRLFDWVRQVMRPDIFAVIEQAAIARGLDDRDRGHALRVISKIVLHTGKDVDQLVGDDVLEVFAWSMHGRSRRREVPGLPTAWELLSVVGVTPPATTLRAALRRGQRTTAELIDDYDLRCRPIRDLLVRYLDERRPALDYNSLSNLAGVLAGSFWADIEKHHPGIDTLHLTDEVAQAWKERVRVVTTADGATRLRQDIYRILMRVRAFYLDIQQWALEDPSWVPWAVPSAVRKNDTQGYEKVKKKRQAAMHQRTRDRLPRLPVLADTAERCRVEAAALLDAASECTPGEVFDYADNRYRRIVWKSATKTPRSRGNLSVGVETLATGKSINLTRREDEAFWAWAIIEVLRHSGVRLEELLEITHLALVSYKLPDTGEVVPLLQIVPSKSNEERLLLVSPELASVLATVITRLRSANSGIVPLVARYDAHERITGSPLPHLFQRALGARREVMSAGTVYRLINTVLSASGLRDAVGQPLVYRPHDFRRIFTTAAVTGGLPVHIAARLLGHKSIATTETYMAVFQEELIRSYRSFLDRRRATRPIEEYRLPTEQEWLDFQQHFHVRKLELGACGRPYGSPCQHEHSCIRCPMLRVSPTQRSRLVEIIRNLADRITEARMNGWLGEVQGLQVSLVAAREKLTNLDRNLERLRTSRSNGTTDLGISVITTSR